MAKTPALKKVESELADVRRDLRWEKEARLKAEGKIEQYKEKEEREQEERRMLVRRQDEHMRQLESEVAWMRRLVEFLCIPEEKLKTINEFKERVQISGDPGFPPRY